MNSSPSLYGKLPFLISINLESFFDFEIDIPIAARARTKKGTRSTLLYRVRGTRKPTRRQSMERAPKKAVPHKRSSCLKVASFRTQP